MPAILSILLLSTRLSSAEPAPGGDAAAPTAVAPAPAVDPSEIVGPPAGPPLSGDALEAQTHAVSKLLRCPVCQGLSVADSPSESALAMKAEVQDLVARGYDEEQILLYFEASYGEFIRLEPTFEGFNVAVWLAPLGLILTGLGIVGALLRVSSRGRTPPSAGPSAGGGGKLPASPPIDPELEPYLRRVREETR